MPRRVVGARQRCGATVFLKPGTGEPEGPEARTILFASPYREASIIALARAAAARGLLRHFYTTYYTGHAAAIAKRFGTRPPWQRVVDRLQRRSFTSLPASSVRSVALTPEAVHVLARKLPTTRHLAPRIMHWAKRRFDRQVAAHVGTCGAAVAVGQLQSSLWMLHAARSAGLTAVLNFVNSHPAHHNAVLRELGGLPGSHPEMVPASAVDRAERELEAADVVLVPSRYVARQLSTRGIPESRLLVHPYGVDLDTFHPCGDQTSGAGPLRCLFVGNVWHTKGVPFLLDAVRRLPSKAVSLTLVGAAATPSLLRRLPANATWVPPRPTDQIAAMMRRADVLLAPSLDDAFPLVTLEGLASGLAVIVSDHCGAAELIRDGIDGLCVPAADSEALAAALSRLADDRGLVSRLGRAARARATEFTWDRFAEAVLARLAPGHVSLASSGHPRVHCR
jgi:glycosyltransferase involved in cell wall biosynthesis